MPLQQQDPASSTNDKPCPAGLKTSCAPVCGANSPSTMASTSSKSRIKADSVHVAAVDTVTVTPMRTPSQPPSQPRWDALPMQNIHKLSLAYIKRSLEDAPDILPDREEPQTFSPVTSQSGCGRSYSSQGSAKLSRASTPPNSQMDSSVPHNWLEDHHGRKSRSIHNSATTPSVFKNITPRSMGWEVFDGSPRMNGGKVSEDPWGDPSVFGIGKDPFQECNNRKSQTSQPATRSSGSGSRISNRPISRHPDGRDDEWWIALDQERRKDEVLHRRRKEQEMRQEQQQQPRGRPGGGLERTGSSMTRAGLDSAWNGGPGPGAAAASAEALRWHLGDSDAGPARRGEGFRVSGACAGGDSCTGNAKAVGGAPTPVHHQARTGTNLHSTRKPEDHDRDHRDHLDSDAAAGPAGSCQSPSRSQGRGGRRGGDATSSSSAQCGRGDAGLEAPGSLSRLCAFFPH